jgi:hypothetical protein
MNKNLKNAAAAQQKLVDAAGRFVTALTLAGEFDELSAEMIAAAELASPAWSDIGSGIRLGEGLAARGAITLIGTGSGHADISVGLRLRYLDCLYAHAFWPVAKMQAERCPGIYPADLAFNLAAAIVAGAPERIEALIAIVQQYREHRIYIDQWPDADQAPLAFFLADSVRAGRLAASDGLGEAYRTGVEVLRAGRVAEAAETFLSARAAAAVKHVRADTGAYSGHAYSLLPVDFLALAHLAGTDARTLGTTLAPLLTPAMCVPERVGDSALASAVERLVANAPRPADVRYPV